MSLPRYFISGDWGTTNFRLRLVETDSLRVLAEHKTDQGIRALYEKYSRQNEVGQFQFFCDYLKAQLLALPAEHRGRLVVLAGMASSNIGLQELEYAGTPFEQSGSSLPFRYLSCGEAWDILLISGVKSESGMMRGEEIQAIGLAERLAPYGGGVLLLPGTHSKHITYRQGEFTALKNFMTGELFEVLSQKSILANSVTGSAWDKTREEAFKEGLALGFEGRLNASLLSVRAKHLIQHSNKEDNYYLLSGMLIGDELSYLKQAEDNIFLAAADPVFGMYQLALRLILDPRQLVPFDGKALEHALLVGQRKMLALHGK